ncbi:MAG TPA: peptidase M61 [Caulobacteraceae bacterium]|jgi:predicted metalloprotease with PDZ domain|nr:peptidase M61 [Caulobacteraceae bacterium]
MRGSRVLSSALPWVLALAGSAAASPGPTPGPAVPSIRAPEDRPYPGVIRLSVDASDIDRRIVRVHETIPLTGEDLTLLYPQWVPGGHAPENPIDRLSGLTISADGKPAAWTRDVVNVFAFHVDPPKGAASIAVDFQYVAPVREAVGPTEITSRMMDLQFLETVLYPAGYYARRIPVEAEATLPEGWSYATALGDAAPGPRVAFKATTLETLLDSPLYAGRYFSRVDLNPGAAAPVHLDVFADKPDQLEIKPAVLAAHRALVKQALKLFGSRHFDHYDFLFSVSGELEQQGLEHHRSSENGADADYFTDYDRKPEGRDLLAHEFTHSWNGKFRRPEDLWTPNYNVPMRDSLLWVYEGQTQYWGYVLTGRSGLWTRQQTLDMLAIVAATFDVQPGRRWRPLRDTTNDEIINPRRPQSWPDWQRFESYYSEGALIWLDVDTLIRERSHGARSLDDFARAFFGVDDGDYGVRTYVFEDVVRALNAVEPYDWATFLRARLDQAGAPAPLDGLKRGGYRLTYTDKPTDFFTAREVQNKYTDLSFSIGLTLGRDGVLKVVGWDSAAFKAGLTPGMTILAVNGDPYDADVLKAAIRQAKGSPAPIELIVKTADRFKVVQVDYHGGLRYPRLERDASQPARLDDILTPRN